MKLILDIGCGNNKKVGAIGLDAMRHSQVDIIADAHFLPFKDEVFDHVYASHIIEHFGHQEVKTVVIEWTRTLKTDGVLEIRCPWLPVRALLFFINPSQENIKNIYGGQDTIFNYHKCGFSSKLLKNLLRQCGYGRVKRIPVRRYFGIPLWEDLHITAIKKDTTRSNP